MAYRKDDIPKVKLDFPKIDLSGVDFAIKNMNAIFDNIVKDIRERQDNAMAMEFTKCIGELLRKNGVIPKITEYTRENVKENSIEKLYGVTIDELDFTEHDKLFENKIAKLEKENKSLNSYLVQREQDSTDMIMNLKQRIAELESKETETSKKEPISDDCRPSMEWYENRHQSDCIEINRLNTTIDVLIHKVEYLRQFAGLE